MPRAMLGEVELNVVESEKPDYSNDITDNPVESGVAVSDHVRPKPLSFTISGTVAGADAGAKVETLRQYSVTGQLLRYVGRNIFENMVIETLSTTHDVEVKKGFKFEIDLKQVRIAEKREIQYTGTDPVTGADISPAVTPKGNKGTQQTDSINLDAETEAAMMQSITH